MGGAQQHLTLDGQIGPGCSKQVFRVQSHLHHVTQMQGRVIDRQFEVDPFRQKILDEESLAGKRGRLQVGINRHAPLTARRVSGNREVEQMATRAKVIAHGPDIFHAIRTRQDGSQRQTGDRFLLAIAGQSCGMNGLAGPVSAAIGGQEDVNRRGGLMPGHTTVRQIKLRIGQRQEGGVHRAVTRHDHRRGGAVGATYQARLKDGVTISIGFRRRQNLIRHRQQLHIDAGSGGGIPK